MKYRTPIVVIAFALVLTFLWCSPGKKENIFNAEYTDKPPLEDMVYTVQAPDESLKKLGSCEESIELTETQTLQRTTYTIKMPCVMQEPELPTGCEITSLTSVLNYLGYDVTKTELAKNYLTTASLGQTSFDKAFIGNPASDGGYGCYAPVIVEAAQKYLIEKTMEHTAWNISGTEFDDLFDYIDQDIPVIVWASMNLMDVELTDAYYDQNEKPVKWYNNEHCMVLCGYDQSDNTVIAADPLKGLMKYNRDRFKMIYDKLEKQAIIIK